MTLTQEQVLDRIKDHLRKRAIEKGAPEHVAVEIYTGYDESGHGVRVAEVDFTYTTPTGSVGSSFMASDPDSAVACFAVERLAIGLMEQEDMEEIDTLLWRLDYAVWGEGS